MTGRRSSRLLPQLFEFMIGSKGTVQEQEAARQLIREGEVIVILDGLDELARNWGQNVVKNFMFELEALVAGSGKARIVVSCRNHIFETLRKTGSLGNFGNGKPIKISAFDCGTVENALRKKFEHALPPTSKGRQPDELRALALLAETPLLYQMVLSAGEQHLRELLGVCKDMPKKPKADVLERRRTDLQDKWFEVMLKETGEAKNGIKNLGLIAGDMLKRRSDVVEIREGGQIASNLGPLIQRLSEPPFVLFTGEQQRRNTYAFSHQSLREFVLAKCVHQEIIEGEFDLLTSSPSFDYEGGEFYARVHDLFGIEPYIEEHIIKRLESLLRNPGSLCEEQWNHLARNLFEMLGELLPDDDTIAEKATGVALKYLNPNPNALRYVSFKTRYNVARCLERIHDSAPRPYNRHTLEFHSTWPKSPRDDRHVGAHAIRGFHLLKQEPRPVPPLVFNGKSSRSGGLMHLEKIVSKALIDAVLQLDVPEMFEDAAFLGINCTHALIRWLPQTPDPGQIQEILAHRYTSKPMKQNIFWALYLRGAKGILRCLKRKGFFKDCGPLAWHDGKAWASEKALNAYNELLQADSQVKQPSDKS